ncbi:pyridoxal phosphate-dependent aminotransferase [Rhizobium sp. SL86]|uniref:pyridoxal phosphate-dependent aminotransferase n=1 Tax=Rhizobium sp. SL86 TaxID=2995148 RepID=UPI002272A60B|nr:pyridoxal phosphate-dependent aminotransferase [Rhizobium sp. SL86]MCY1667413.1 pyridoxal phosphate-dependent aminotransferase [Rhizobium sp. SL86]
MDNKIAARHQALTAFSGIRDQVKDLHTENIAAMATRASKLDDVIALWYGEGDMVTPSFIRDAAKKALDDGETFYVPDMRGASRLQTALSDYQSRLYGKPIGLTRSTVSPGGMQALYIALALIAEMGTNVVYVAPQWPNIHNAIHLLGAEPRAVALQFDKGWRLDLDRLFAACDARTRAIFLSTPANPTGWTASADEMAALLEFSRRTGIWIISDEVYGRIYFDGDVAPSMLAIAEDEDRVMTINSFSKAWAMTGWRVGWLTHPNSVADQVAAMTQYINSGTPAVIQAGAVAALEQGEPLVADIRQRIKTGLDIVYDGLAQINSIMLPEKPQGGMYAFFGLAGVPDAREACSMILESARVGLAPGHLFGDSSTGFIRLCVFRDTERLKTAVDRMVVALR